MRERKTQKKLLGRRAQDEDLLRLAGRRAVCGFVCFALASAAVCDRSSEGVRKSALAASTQQLAQGSQVKASDGTQPAASQKDAASRATNDSSQKDLAQGEGTSPATVGTSPVVGDPSLRGEGAESRDSVANARTHGEDQQRGNATHENTARNDAQDGDEQDEDTVLPPSVSVCAGEQELHDGVTIRTRATLCVTVADPDLVLEDDQPQGIMCELTDDCGMTVPFEDTWTREDGEALEYSLTTTNDVADGSYVLRVRAQNSAGKQTDVRLEFVVDTQAPHVVERLDVASACAWETDTCYFDCAQDVEVSISDATLDLDETMVNGRTLADLLAADAQGEHAEPDVPSIQYGIWDMREEDGVTTYSCAITYGQGSYALPVVRAYDQAQNATIAAHEHEGRTVGSFVVDTQAPKVLAAVLRSPAMVVGEDTDDGAVAFFDAPTTIELTFEDASGIQSVELIDDASHPSGYRLKEVAANKASACVELGAKPFTAALVVTVRDKANNMTQWSLNPRGYKVEGGTRRQVTNEPLRIKSTGELVCEATCPLTLVVDDEAPSLTLHGIADGSHIRSAQHLTLDVVERHLGYVALLDPQQVVLNVCRQGEADPTIAQTVAYEGACLGDGEHTYDVTVPADSSTHEHDGVYAVQASLHDFAGNVTATELGFTIDTTPPVLDVSFDDVAHQGSHYRGARTATLRVVDKNLSAARLNASTLVRVDVRASDGATTDDVKTSIWEDQPDGSCTCCVEFPANGTFELGVSGADEAGNALVGGRGTTLDERGVYASGVFVCDATKPQVEFAYAATSPDSRRYAGTDYFRVPAHVRVTVRDRNLDLERTTVTDSAGNPHVPRWRLASRDSDGTCTYVATLTYVEEESGRDAGRKRLMAHAVDLAGNERVRSWHEFVVDQTAPSIDGVRVSKRPTALGVGANNSSPMYFYNQHDGVPARLTLTFADEYGLAAVWVDDPANVYDVRTHDVGSKRSASVSITLKDRASSGGNARTDLGRNVRVYGRDLAGNVRMWCIGPKGEVVAERADDAKNPSLYADGVYPLALVMDTRAPLVQVVGAQEGEYYKEPRTMRVEVEEHEFEQLLRFDSDRTVAIVNREAPDGSHTQTALHAGEFEGTRPHFATEFELKEDGHYSIVASVADMSNNRSDTVRIKTFTIDRTVPIVSVSWDNNDVRNGRYYKAPRTATVQVREHNFDERLFSVDTTGAMSAWTSEGDVHTCTVSFAHDALPSAPHKLRVSGRDKAGNEAVDFAEPDFVIDTKAPTVHMKKRVSEDDRLALADKTTELVDCSAFAQGMAPVVELADDANFDAAGIEVSLVGTRAGATPASVSSGGTTTLHDGGATVTWDNLGMMGQGADGHYLMEADDVYTLSACVTDKAGNSSQRLMVRFSLNRFGSNYFVEPVEGLQADERGVGSDVPLTESPRIVVHEVNVSGSEDDDHLVAVEHAHATTRLERVEGEQDSGYTLTSSTDASAWNAFEGWSEHVYAIGAGNFGEGSALDFGDGGQGDYRVTVSSRDRAHNNNTTDAFWASDSRRASEGASGGGPATGVASVAFTLDEQGPVVRDLRLPRSPVITDEYLASFFLDDEITQGDIVRVTVDGEQTEVFREGSSVPLEPDESVRSGTYTFAIHAKPALFAQEVQVSVSDYTASPKRTHTVRASGVRVTTLVAEGIGIAILTLLTGVLVGLLRWHSRRSRNATPTRE